MICLTLSMCQKVVSLPFGSSYCSKKDRKVNKPLSLKLSSTHRAQQINTVWLGVKEREGCADKLHCQLDWI